MSSSVETRPAKTPKFVAVIDENIGLVQRKIRLGDLSRGLLALAALTCGYLLVAAGLDLAFRESLVVLVVRCVLFGMFAIAFLGLAGWTLVRYLTRGVNPYFAARRLEATIPDSKNSIINWLDLRDQKIPPAIYQAVGLRAARDVEAADPEEVVSKKEIARLGIAVAGFAAGLVLLFLIVPHQFGSLIAHAFAPLRSAPVLGVKSITLVRPADGDAVVPANQRVDILALIEGRIPDAGSPGALTIHYRNDPTDLYQRLPLEEDNDGRWAVRLTPEQIRSGLFYKLTAGSVSTPEHRLTVRTQPFVSEFAVTYRYRDYRKVRPETVVFPNAESHEPRILAHRGTEVVFEVTANTPIAKGTLEFESAGKRTPMKSEPRGDDPKTLSFRWTLDRSGSIRVLFESPGGEKNVDRDSYEVRVLDDGPPLVELVEPGKDMGAAANGTLLLVGIALDEFGVTGLSLHVRIPGKKEPYTQPYLGGKSWKFDDGSYPRSIKYFDTLRLDKLALASGTELEYWLEATDNCDYPKPNVGKSRVYKLKLITPDDPGNQKVKRDRAETQAIAGQKQEDSEHGQENKDKNDKKDGGDNGAGNGNSQQDQAKEDQVKQDMTKTGDKVQNQAKNDSGNQTGSNERPDPNPNKSDVDPKTDAKSEPNKDGKSEPSPKNADGSPNKADTSPEKSNTPGPKTDAKQSGDKNPDGSAKDGNPGGSNPGKAPDAGKGSDSKDSKSDNGKSPPSKDRAGGDKNDKDKVNPDAKEGDKKGPAGAKEKTDETAGNGGSTPGTKPGDPKDKTTGEGGNENGTQKETTKKDNAKKMKGETSTNGKTEATNTPPDKDSKAKGEAKDPGDKGTATKTNDSKNPKTDPKIADKSPEPTKEEIDNLQELLEKKAPEADKLAKELAARGRDMQNPENKKALQNALKKAGRQDDLNTMNNEEQLAPPMAGDGSQQPKTGDKGIGSAAGGNDKKDDKGTDPAASTGGGKGYDDELKAMTPDEAFRRRLGSLQIDDIEALKKRMSPDDLKKAGVSPEEWQQFLRNAQEYQRLLDRRRAARKDAKTLQGGASQIGGTGPRIVAPSPNATQSPLEGAAVSPPLEFQDAQRDFTRGRNR